MISIRIHPSGNWILPALFPLSNNTLALRLNLLIRLAHHLAPPPLKPRRLIQRLDTLPLSMIHPKCGPLKLLTHLLLPHVSEHLQRCAVG
jgi:hypothetical protein